MKHICTAAIATLGCKLNQSESDLLARQLAERGVEIVPFGGPADLCIINSCTVTHIGDRKSRQLVRQAVRANPDAFVAVAGCYAELEPGAVSAIEGVGAVIGNSGKSSLVDTLSDHGLALGPGAREDLLTGRAGGSWRELAQCQGPQASPAVPAEDSSLITHHSSLGSRTRAFVKIQEGCDNHCSYCIVPVARGHQRSVPAEEVLTEIRRLSDEGYQEIVLTGVNITTYGRDHGSPEAMESARGMGLVRLLHDIVDRTEIPRIRLSSLQPEDWNPRFYELWNTGRLCRQLHLSLQSGSDPVLRRMRRRYNTSQYARIVDEARQRLPGVAVTTDVIVGFPGESEAEHAETEAFLRSIGFAGLHVFKYSPRAGTDAAAMPGQIEPRVKQRRSERLIALADEIGESFRAQFAGQVLSVLWEEPLSATQAGRLGLEPASGRIFWSGISDNYVRVYAEGTEVLHGTVTGARIGAVAGDGVIGTLVRR